MYKKLICNLLVIALINLFGCYTTELVKPDEYMKYEKESGKPKEIFVIKKDSSKYHFNSWEYLVDEDTLSGKGTLIVNDHRDTFEGDIALSDIESIQWAESNMAITVLSLVGAAFVIFIIFSLLAVGASYDNI
jgi:hypothetical protein